MIRLREHGSFPFLGIFSIAVVMLVTASGLAVEESRRFLEALRGRGLHEQSILYLERMKESPLAPADFKEVIDYELGVALINAAMSGRIVELREKQLNQA